MTDAADSPDRQRMRRWLEHWAHAGRELEAERMRHLSRMTDDEARELTRELLELWRPSELDDMGEELVAHQHWFRLAARGAGRR